MRRLSLLEHYDAADETVQKNQEEEEEEEEERLNVGIQMRRTREKH